MFQLPERLASQQRVAEHGLPRRSQTLADVLPPASEGISLRGITEVQGESVLYGSGGHLSLKCKTAEMGQLL